MKRILAALLLALPVAVTMSCSGKKEAESAAPAAQAEPSALSDAAAPKQSLYERLGGEAAIKAVVDEFVANVGADTRINQYFANANLDRLKEHLVNQIGQASGGPQQYTGRDMKTVHTGLMINKKEWDASVKHLVATLDKFKVPAKEKGEVLAAIGSLEKDIVEKP